MLLSMAGIVCLVGLKLCEDIYKLVLGGVVRLEVSLLQTYLCILLQPHLWHCKRR